VSRRKRALIDQARKQHGQILPCAGKTFEECFTFEGGELFFWFNLQDGNTRVLIEGRVV
jgi:hypothetical protein